MFGVLLAVACYTISSLGDKYISSKLKCSPAEFAFIVSFATMLWIGITLSLTGWGYQFNRRNGVILSLLVLWKLIELYTSALLLKTVSAYELKAWLGINIVCSYLYNVLCGIYQTDLRMPCWIMRIVPACISGSSAISVSVMNGLAEDREP